MVRRSTIIALTSRAAATAGFAMSGGLGTTIMTTTMTMPPGAGVD